MLTIVQYPPAFGMRNASPFCLKVEALLRHAELPYTIEVGDVRRAPHGKFPVLRDGDQVVADSTCIRQHLERTRGKDFDAGLDACQRAVGRAFTLLCEDHLYWAIVTSRWRNEPNWVQLREAFFGDVPALVRPFVTYSVRRHILNRLAGHGMGDHSDEAIYQFAREDLDALETQLGDHRYLLGATRSSADATVFAHLYSIAACPLDSPLRQDLRSRSRLVHYIERIEDELFSS